MTRTTSIPPMLAPSCGAGERQGRGGEGFECGASTEAHCHISLARPVDLHQSKRTRLPHSYYKRGAGHGLFRRQPLLCLGYPLGPVFDLELHTRAKRGCRA